MPAFGTFFAAPSGASRRLLPALAVSVGLLLAACGGGGAAGSTTSPGGTTPGTGSTPGAPATQSAGGGQLVDACALLTDEDIEAVTGNPVVSKAEGPQFGIFDAGCQWELSSDQSIVPPSMSLGIMPSGGRQYYDQYFAPFNAQYGYDAIENLGDEAVDAEAGSVLVVAGDTFFNLQYLGMTADDTELAAELGRRLVTNLGT